MECSPSPPNIPARLAVLLLLSAGSAWGGHALGLRWLWAVPLGFVAGVVVYFALVALGGSHSHGGCCPEERMPRSLRESSPPPFLGPIDRKGD